MKCKVCGFNIPDYDDTRLHKALVKMGVCCFPCYIKSKSECEVTKDGSKRKADQSNRASL